MGGQVGYDYEVSNDKFWGKYSCKFHASSYEKKIYFRRLDSLYQRNPQGKCTMFHALIDLNQSQSLVI